MAQYGPYDRSLRAADSDRESVAAILREQHVAGRIDDDELQDRIERCYTAKTYADLDAVIADLPHEEPAVTSRGTLRALRLWPRFAFLPLLLIAIVALSHGHLFWLVIPFLFFSVRPMLWRAGGRRGGWASFGCAPGHDTVV
jgi:hypothetical protein